METTQSLLNRIAELDAQLATFGAVPDDQRDGLLLEQRALRSRLDAVQQRESQRPHLVLIRGGGWDRTLGLDVA